MNDSDPQTSAGWLDRGVERLQAGDLAAAEAAFRQATQLAPDHAGALHNWSVVLRMQGQPAAAEPAARQAMALAPSQAAIWLNLGNVLHDLKRWDEAADAFLRAVELEPANAAAWCNLGIAEQWRGRPIEAQVALEQSLRLAPDDTTAQINYAQLVAGRGQSRMALDILQKLVAREPELAAAWAALGNTFRLLGAAPAAAQAYRRSLALDPENFEARHRLTQVLLGLWRLDEAESLLAENLVRYPWSPAVWAVLGSAHLMQGQAEQAVEALRRAVQIEPLGERHSALLAALQYVPGVTAAQLLPAHKQWDAVYVPRPMPLAPAVRADRGGPLRIGFVSSDLSQHPVARILLPILQHLDREQCTAVCYADGLQADELTQRLFAAAGVWRPSGGLTDGELADQIRRDEIDVLVDLMGHTGSRLLVFAQRPAPLAVSWFGYVGTTGLEAIDALLADRYHVPPGEEKWYREQILRLPHSYACYAPPANAPEIRPLPAAAAGRMTFGCFNNSGKLSPLALDLFAKVLARVQTAQLLLKFTGLDQPGLQRLLRSEFAARGVDPSRLLIEGGDEHTAFLSAYRRVDLALDTQPYSGGVTTCESLWMGVPVVTLTGRSFAGRHATSYLNTAGLSQFVASDATAYVELAADWSARLNDLAALRAGLREQVRRSPLGDVPAFARDFVALLRSAWTARAARG